ncbi:MAG: hypothetical protein RsTaC01_1019 [Candidatus Paraimprobicoccus trichonymphae]|uniref:Uncharacterized protein n=1 Tax=Candidatus Paraimprobicoccus trichonymphae TaxID=3033793 RepID=A0AA48HX86_9FIRM|nr:MAG: hypothetical protein RsTaC01_1019 [Candidatus Paraimprobicoccus trichonymphae]
MPEENSKKNSNYKFLKNKLSEILKLKKGDKLKKEILKLEKSHKLKIEKFEKGNLVFCRFKKFETAMGKEEIGTNSTKKQANNLKSFIDIDFYGEEGKKDLKNRLKEAVFHSENQISNKLNTHAENGIKLAEGLKKACDNYIKTLENESPPKLGIGKGKYLNYVSFFDKKVQFITNLTVCSINLISKYAKNGEYVKNKFEKVVSECKLSYGAKPIIDAKTIEEKEKPKYDKLDDGIKKATYNLVLDKIKFFRINKTQNCQ